MVSSTKESAIPYRIMSDSARLATTSAVVSIVTDWVAEVLGNPQLGSSIDVRECIDFRKVGVSASLVALVDSKPIARVQLPASTLPFLLSIPIDLQEQREMEAESSIVAQLQFDLMAEFAKRLLMRFEKQYVLERLDALDCVRPMRLVAEIGDCREALGIELAPSLIEHLSPASQAVRSVKPGQFMQGLAETAVHVSARLGGTRIDVAELTSLAVGDVLVVDTRVDEACTLLTDDSIVIGGVQIGRHKGRLSVMVTNLMAPLAE